MTDAIDSALLAALRAGRPLLWLHERRSPAHGLPPLELADIHAVRDRFQRFAPLLARLFPELQASQGVIESPLVRAPRMQAAAGLAPRHGSLWIKADHQLPVAGSIKARGGIHEVIEFAEVLALREGVLRPGDDYTVLADPRARDLFRRYTVSVGSTGNLGLSIGVMASALGFRTVVHMSSDAKAWKKQRLRRLGVEVVEHVGDYARAVASGRAEAAGDPASHFVDDERSLSLLLGYSAAALHLRAQLAASGVPVDAQHPLFVYLPCGVGGAPAGIAFGLGQVYGPHVHFFFAEPTRSPCFLVQMAAGDRETSVYDVGLDNRTEADGLAVPRASQLAAGLMRDRLAGVFTVEDDTLFRCLFELERSEGMAVEPSAAAGLPGPGLLCETETGRSYLERHRLVGAMPGATHVVWTTGGLFVPDAEMGAFRARGAALAASGMAPAGR